MLFRSCDNSFTPVSGELSQSFTPSVIGNYAIKIFQSICVDTSSCYQVSVVGINNLFQKNNIRIYPNPALISIYIDDLNNYLFQITDIVGQVIIQQKCNNNHENIDISQLQNGIYFIKVQTENGMIINKIIKE